jgi:TonB family protein
MLFDRVFQIAFAVSILIHGGILLTSPGFSLFSKQPAVQTQVQYVKNISEAKELRTDRLIKDEPFLRSSAKLTADKRTPPPFVDKDTIFSTTRQINTRQGLYTRPSFPKSDIVAIKRRVTLPAVDMDKINNPSYLSYYQIVREKIRRSAYQNYTRSDTGEVFLSFIISNSGELKEVHLNEDRSSTSSYLRQTAMRSMEDSAPFPSFPTELDYPQLSFNVVISFEIE